MRSFGACILATFLLLNLSACAGPPSLSHGAHFHDSWAYRSPFYHNHGYYHPPYRVYEPRTVIIVPQPYYLRRHSQHFQPYYYSPPRHRHRY